VDLPDRSISDRFTSVNSEPSIQMNEITIEQLKVELLKAGLPDDLDIGLKDIDHAQLIQIIETLKEFKDLFAADPNNPGSVELDYEEVGLPDP